jgi:uncharacterized protein (TIGR03435 family)
MAYEIKPRFIEGGDKWIDSTLYDIDAKFSDDDASVLSKLSPADQQERVNLMLRSLLEDRFHLSVKRSRKKVPCYRLIIAKGGPKILPSTSPGSDGQSNNSQPAALTTAHGWIVNREPMSFWAYQLSMQPDIDRMVVDHTGLTGNYRFRFSWESSTNGAGESIFTALEEQLGLKLIPAHDFADVLIIVHADLPSPN